MRSTSRWRCYTRLLSYTRLYGLTLTSAPPTPMLCPKTSLLFLLLPLSKLALLRWLALLLRPWEHISPRPFWCSSRNPPEEEAAQIYFRVIQDSIASRWHPPPPPFPSCVPRTIFSFFSWPYQNWLCSSDCVCGEAFSNTTLQGLSDIVQGINQQTAMLY